MNRFHGGRLQRPRLPFMESDSEIARAAMQAEDAFRRLTYVVIVLLVVAALEAAAIGWLLGVLADGHHEEGHQDQQVPLKNKMAPARPKAQRQNSKEFPEGETLSAWAVVGNFQRFYRG